MNKIKASEFISRVPRNGQEAYEMLVELFGPRAAEIIGEWKAERIAAKKVEEAKQIIYQEALQEGIEKGREEGREEAMREYVINLLKNFPEWSDARIAELTKTTEDVVRRIRQELATLPSDDEAEKTS